MIDSSPLQVEPPVRQRVADHVFETLIKAILKGELRPGEPLPTQRELARRFHISALVVRQAIHRLEDLGLVRVRQGSATIVLDPTSSGDIRLIQIQLEMAEAGSELADSVLENQALFVVPLLALAERRITKEELAELDAMVDRQPAEADAEQARRFRSEYWGFIAKATRNLMYQQQMHWWFTIVDRLDQNLADVRGVPFNLTLDLYKKLNASLARGSGTPAIWLEGVEPVLRWFDARVAERSRKR